MAYYLAFTSGSEYVDIPSPISVSGDGVLAEIDFVYKGATNNVICGGTSFSDYWRIDRDNQFRISIAGSSKIVSISTPFVVGTRYTLKLVRTGSSVEVRDSTNTAITSATNISANPFIIGKIGSFHNGSSNLTMDLYGFKAGAETYDPSLSNGTGITLPTVSGSNQGVLTNFPTDDSQWVFYSAPSTGVTVNVTESTSDFGEFSSTFFSANISAQVTEVNASFTESSSATITNNIVSVSVTETSQDFSESASASISGSLSALVTELSQSFTESSIADISANISAAITELAQDFNESAQVNLTSSFTVEVTEATSDFEESCYIQLPVIRLTPRKTISVSNRSGSTIRVRRRSSVIRVK